MEQGREIYFPTRLPLDASRLPFLRHKARRVAMGITADPSLGLFSFLLGEAAALLTRNPKAEKKKVPVRWLCFCSCLFLLALSSLRFKAWRVPENC